MAQVFCTILYLSFGFSFSSECVDGIEATIFPLAAKS